jgi:hypothetical protein
MKGNPGDGTPVMKGNHDGGGLFVNPMEGSDDGGKPAEEQEDELKDTEPVELTLSPVFNWTRTWAKYSGAIPNNNTVARQEGRASPTALHWYLTFSVGYYFLFQIVWTVFTFWTARHVQTHGEAHAFPRLDITVDGRNITRGFQNQGDLDQDARGERCCDDAAEGDMANGQPVSFGKWRAKLQSGVITAVRFPLVGVPYGTNISTATLSLEMEGAALYWLPEDADSLPLTVGIRLEYAASSDVLRFMPHLCE